MPPPEEPHDAAMRSLEAKIETLGKVLGIQLNNIEKQMASDGRTHAQQITSLAELVDRLTVEVKDTYVRQDVYVRDHKDVVDDIATLRDSIRFVSRTAWTAFLLPAVVMVFGYVFLAGGPP